ncbi:hypothetical protein MOMA_08676 [Moraxella macacae 0408225]|uniref:Uncharacterized protein n=1 Tax=Moraxella macacae 0408225 TaxID=1230338 RepID=L2F789_9GAMM|nr:hypothetical protein [Moraxella macacae]ELA08621.1 hypothetical protein MOMA_08676 [Moraxella macacae 0408225]
MKNSQQNPTLASNIRSLPQFFEQGLRPVIPLLADNCSLSISQVRQSLPFLCNAVACQWLAKTVLTKTVLKKTPPTMPAFWAFFADLQHKSPLVFAIHDGMDFNKLQQNQTNSQNFLRQLFDDEQKFALMMGVLLQKSQLPYGNLEKLLGLVAWLSVNLLSAFYQYVTDNQNVTDNQTNDVVQQNIVKQSIVQQSALLAWQHYQMFALHTPDNQVFCQIVHYVPKLGIFQSQKQANMLAKSDDLQNLAPKIELFLAQKPLAIVPNPPKSTKKSAKQISKQAQSNSINQSTDIFAKPTAKQATWVDFLQKYWIATGIGLTAIVMGVVGLLLSDDNAADTKNQADNAKPRYQDVAIIKVTESTDAIKPQKSAKDSEKVKPSKTGVQIKINTQTKTNHSKKN